MIELTEKPRQWLNDMATEHHYMHRPIHQKSVPFGWAVKINGEEVRPDGRPVGFIIFATIHYTKLGGEFGYPGLPTKWQVLSLARLWLHPDCQRGGQLCTPENIPGFVDRFGEFRSTLATHVIDAALGVVQGRWLQVHPPRFIDQPYHILKIISYADTRYHTGKIYRAGKFRFSGRTISAKRHKNSRGPGMDGAELLRFIRDLPEPTWEFTG
jgi:hypothetical protein